MSDEAARHRRKMEIRKTVQDAEVASKTITEKGLLILGFSCETQPGFNHRPRFEIVTEIDDAKIRPKWGSCPRCGNSIFVNGQKTRYPVL